MVDRPLTLMAVHAHPDDETTFTAGILAKYAAEGVRTVVVVCTDGGCGDGPGGVKPGEPGHDPVALAALRRTELEASCRVLKVSDLELLGYADSGMMGWPQNDAPNSLWSVPLDKAAARLAELMQQHRPDVVVTYDPDGFYGHPDHIKTHRITTAAVERSGVPAKVYWVTVQRDVMAQLAGITRELAGERGDADGVDEAAYEASAPGATEEEITTRIDVSEHCDRMLEALSMHESQSPNISLLSIGLERYTQLSNTESYIRVSDSTGAELPETDLFAGLR